MAKVRQDAWSKENDLLLADTVLRHVREGSTQLLAFEEVGDKLNRTSAACGFRWNAIVRDQYQQAMEIAKKQRKERKRMQSRQSGQPKQPRRVSEQPVSTTDQGTTVAVQSEQGGSHLTLNDVIAYLKDLKAQRKSSEGLQTSNERLEKENEHFRNENEDLKKQLAKMTKDFHTVKEDYQSLIQIMDRARKMVVFGDEENTSSFKMDKNGNLEKMAK
ncbi:MAG TPA: RsfA family transcriptional regulator [Bacillales bacterium]|nr:RsfA family transcriptional regulator [Bacillales bacterium]